MQRTALEGAFVVAWAATGVDGEIAAPFDALVPGATWRWDGPALRVDGPPGVMRLGRPLGEDDLSARIAARRLRGLPGAEAEEDSRPPPPPFGFQVTDGRALWPVTLIAGQGRGRPEAGALVLFDEGLPPEGRDLWIVAADLTARAAPVPGREFGLSPALPVATPGGWRALGDLSPGDHLTRPGGGLLRLMRLDRLRLSGARLMMRPDLTPWRLPGGAHPLAAGQRLRLTGPEVRRLFNRDAVLVAAADLPGARPEDRLREVTLITPILAQPGLILGQGLVAEAPGLDPDHPDADLPDRCLTRAEAAILSHRARPAA